MPSIPTNRPHFPSPAVDIRYNDVPMAEHMRETQPMPDNLYTVPTAGAVDDISPTSVSSAGTMPKSPQKTREGYTVVVDVTTWYPAATCTFSPGMYATHAEAVERLAQQLEVWCQNNSIPVVPRENWSWYPGHPISPEIQQQRAWNRDTFRGCVQRVPGPSLPAMVRATGFSPACERCKICERCALLATTRSDRGMQQICDRCQATLYRCLGFGGCSQPANTTAPGVGPELVYRVTTRRISNGSSIDGVKFYWDLDRANSTLQRLVDESVLSHGRKAEDQQWDRRSIVGVFKKTEDDTMYVENLTDNLRRRVCAYVEPILVYFEPQQQPYEYPRQSDPLRVPQYHHQPHWSNSWV